ncbi:hypothetical protein LSAT2_008480 [Lamellibrachia satsuma]|nr:hypothetical protein LSAT2_008480 [Lamellibrachia satsuma]
MEVCTARATDAQQLIYVTSVVSYDDVRFFVINARTPVIVYVIATCAWIRKRAVFVVYLRAALLQVNTITIYISSTAVNIGLRR